MSDPIGKENTAKLRKAFEEESSGPLWMTGALEVPAKSLGKGFLPIFGVEETTGYIAVKQNAMEGNIFDVESQWVLMKEAEEFDPAHIYLALVIEWKEPQARVVLLFNLEKDKGMLAAILLNEGLIGLTETKANLFQNKMCIEISTDILAGIMKVVTDMETQTP